MLRNDEKVAPGHRGDPPMAFGEIHALYRERIFRFALHRLGDPHEAEDLTQEVFLVVHRSLDRFEGRSSLLTWMTGIARNQASHRHRRRSPILVSPERLAELAPSDPAPSPEALVDARRQLRRCAELVEEELPPYQREPFRLRYVESLPVRRIAQRLGRSVGSVKVALSRGRRRLRDHVPARRAG